MHVEAKIMSFSLWFCLWFAQDFIKDLTREGYRIWVSQVQKWEQGSPVAKKKACNKESKRKGVSAGQSSVVGVAGGGLQRGGAHLERGGWKSGQGPHHTLLFLQAMQNHGQILSRRLTTFGHQFNLKKGRNWWKRKISIHFLVWVIRNWIHLIHKMRWDNSVKKKSQWFGN